MEKTRYGPDRIGRNKIEREKIYMKNRNILLSVIVFAAIAAMAMALIPPPPANQNIGFYDTNISSLGPASCHAATPCHGSDDTAIANRHHLLVPRGEWKCQDCHPVDPSDPEGYGVVIERDCIQCHNGTAWSRNPSVVNISRPHHFNTSATMRHCNDCHSYIANYDDGHAVPFYNTSLVTPLADYKLLNATSGRLWGGCQACHWENDTVSPVILNNHDTHHQATSGMPGRQCTWCHVGNSSSLRADGSANVLRIYLTDPGFGWDTVNRHMELRNSTILNLGDTINGTGCQKCHSVATIHNIQYDYTNTIGQLGYGHIGTNWDCDGCHAFWDAGAEAPTGAIIPDMAGVMPNTLTAGAATVVAITGSNFLSGPGTYTSVVSIDGSTLTPDSVTDNRIVVTVPSLAAGIHTIRVVKDGDVSSSPGVLVAVTQADITSAVLAKGKITITGSGFGAQPTPEFKDLGVFVEHTTGKGKAKVTTTIKATIVSWSDNQIVATAQASAGEPLTVKSLNGEDSTRISGAPKPK